MVSNYKQYLMQVERSLGPVQERHLDTTGNANVALSLFTNIAIPVVDNLLKMDGDAFNSNMNARLIESPPESGEEYDEFVNTTERMLSPLQKVNRYITNPIKDFKRDKPNFMAGLQKQESTARVSLATELVKFAENQDLLTSASDQQWFTENLSPELRADKNVMKMLKHNFNLNASKRALIESAMSNVIQVDSELQNYEGRLEADEAINPSLTVEEREQKLDTHSRGMSQLALDTPEFAGSGSPGATKAQLMINERAQRIKVGITNSTAVNFLQTIDNEMKERGIVDPAEQAKYRRQKIQESPDEIRNTIYESGIVSGGGGDLIETLNTPSDTVFNTRLDDTRSRLPFDEDDITDTITPAMALELAEGKDPAFVLNRYQRNARFQTKATSLWMQNQKSKSGSGKNQLQLKDGKAVGSYLNANREIQEQFATAVGREGEGADVAREIFEGDPDQRRAFAAYTISRGGLENMNKMDRAESKLEDEAAKMSGGEGSKQRRKGFIDSLIDDPIDANSPSAMRELKQRMIDHGQASQSTEGGLSSVEKENEKNTLTFLKAQAEAQKKMVLYRETILQFHTVVDGQQNMLRANDNMGKGDTTRSIEHIRRMGEETLSALDPISRAYTIEAGIASVAASGIRNLKSSKQVRGHLNSFRADMSDTDVSEALYYTEGLENQESNVGSALMQDQDRFSADLLASGEPAQAFMSGENGKAAKLVNLRNARFMNHDQLIDEQNTTTSPFYKKHIATLLKSMKEQGKQDPVGFLRSRGITSNKLQPFDFTEGTVDGLRMQLERRQTGIAEGRRQMNGETDFIKLLSATEKAELKKITKQMETRERDSVISGMLSEIEANNYKTTEADILEIFDEVDVLSVQLNQEMFDQSFFGNRSDQKKFGSIDTDTVETALSEKMGSGNITRSFTFFTELNKVLPSAIIGTLETHSKEKAGGNASLSRDAEDGKRAKKTIKQTIKQNFDRIVVGDSSMLIPKGDAKGAQVNIQTQLKQGLQTGSIFIKREGRFIQVSDTTTQREGPNVPTALQYNITQHSLSVSSINIYFDGSYYPAVRVNGTPFTVRTTYDATP